MTDEPQVLAHTAGDNVAVVVVEGLDRQARISGRVLEHGTTFETPVNTAIPFGHKVALADFEAGDRVIKQGETIGYATVTIRRGDHVHTHNLRGDH